MAEAVYLLCALLSIACAVLLLRGFSRTGVRLLLWSGCCFVGLAMNNVTLFVDLVVIPDMDVGLQMLRSLFAISGLGVLLYGLVWEAR